MFSLWHFRRFSFLRCVRHQSTSLRSLRSTSVTRLPRYYGRSDSCSPGSSAYTRSRAFSHELRHSLEQVSPIHRVGLTPIPSPTIRCGLPSLYHATPQLVRFPLSRSRLRHWHAGSPLSPDRIEFAYYGLGVRLLLLPTSPLGDAVALGFGPESVCPERTFASLTNAPFGRTYHRASADGVSGSA